MRVPSANSSIPTPYHHVSENPVRDTGKLVLAHLLLINQPLIDKRNMESFNKYSSRSPGKKTELGIEGLSGYGSSGTQAGQLPEI